MTGIGKAAPLPATAETSGPGPSLESPVGQHQDGDVLVLLDQLEDLLDRLALAHHEFRLDADLLAHPLCMAVERGVGGRLGLLAHDLLDAQPVLEIAGLDHVEQHQHAVGVPAR